MVFNSKCSLSSNRTSSKTQAKMLPGLLWAKVILKPSQVRRTSTLKATLLTRIAQDLKDSNLFLEETKVKLLRMLEEITNISTPDIKGTKTLPWQLKAKLSESSLPLQHSRPNLWLCSLKTPRLRTSRTKIKEGRILSKPSP